jgi:lipopolysaccharide export system protein LptC
MPYEVTARRGWQDEATPTLVHLEAPQGRFRRPAGAEYTITADTGRYDTEAKEARPLRQCRAGAEGPLHGRMDRANIVVEEKRLVSDSPVAVSFGSGTVNANAMQITDDGARILFLNGVKARFDAPQAKGDISP